MSKCYNGISLYSKLVALNKRNTVQSSVNKIPTHSWNPACFAVSTVYNHLYRKEQGVGWVGGVTLAHLTQLDFGPLPNW